MSNTLRLPSGLSKDRFPLLFRLGVTILLLTKSGSSWLACLRAFPSGSLLEPFCRSSEVSALFVPWFFLLIAGLLTFKMLSVNCWLASLRPKINGHYHY